MTAPNADDVLASLLAEGAASDVTGWGFGWLEGRASEERPPWRYSRLLARRISAPDAWLDLQTGGGEVVGEAIDAALASGARVPAEAVATEGWPPNAALARERLAPRGMRVVEHDAGRVPFEDGTFELVTSRHPATIDWHQIARVLAPGGIYLAQHVGPASAFELIEAMLGPLPRERLARDPRAEIEAAATVGLDLVDLREARLRIEIRDVAAAVHLFRKLPWWVPDFTVARYREPLRALHDRIQREGPFVAHSTRHLLELRRR